MFLWAQKSKKKRGFLRFLNVLFSNAACYITPSSTFFDCLFIYVPEKMASNTLHYYLIFLSFKGNIIWTCSVGPVTSLFVTFISFDKKVAIDFCQFFSQLLRILFSLNLWNKKWGSPCSFKRKRAFISLSSLVWGKSLTFCTRARSFAHANDAKIVRSRDAQCKTRESP